MANTTQLTFYIYLTDQATVAALQAQYPNGVSRGPLPAATEFSAPFQQDGDPLTYPCTRTAWYPPLAAGKFPLDRAFFTLNDSFWGHLFGSSRKYAWVGRFVYAAPITQAPAAGQTAGVMRQVAWADGFENWGVGSNNGPNGESSNTDPLSRNASRVPGGRGMACRGASLTVQHSWTFFGATPTGHGWERFYLRLRTRGTGDCGVWQMKCGSNIGLTNSGLVMALNSSGALYFRMVTSGGSLTGANLGLTDALELDRWYLIDVVYDNHGSDTGTEPSSEGINISGKLYIDHVLTSTFTGQTETKVDPPTYRTLDNSFLGCAQGSVGPNDWEYDLDDWLGFILPASQHATHGGAGGADVWVGPITSSPNNAATVVYAGPDWTHGHHVEEINPMGPDATHSANWTGDIRGLSQHTAQPEDILTSSTSGALLAATTRADLIARQDGALGAQAITVAIAWRRATAGDGQLGFTLKRTSADAGTTPMTTVVGQTTDAWDTVLYAPTNEASPWGIHSLLLRFTKAADANLTTVTRLTAHVALVGVWDKCDQWPQDEDEEQPESAEPIQFGIHNAPYPRTPWNRTAVPPDSPVWVKAGTYTGNNLGQDIVAKIPAHFWWVRKTDTAVGAVRWWSSMSAPHWAVAGDLRSGANFMEDPEFVGVGGASDPETRSINKIGGPATAENATGGTYQYIAVGDPGMRFMLNGAFKHLSGTTTFDNVLTDPDFLAELAFFATEFPSGGGFMFFKGPGNDVNGGQQMGGSEGTTFARFLTGILRSMTTLHPSGAVAQTTYNLWRQRDGADYAGFELTEPIVVQIMSYVGDGAASRTIALPRVSGKRPLWAYCQGTTVSGHVRDPSHTGITSSLASAGSSTINTGFTAGGVDSVTVGSTLNASGVSFSLLVIMAADATAGNGGWGTNGEYITDPIPAPGGQWPDGYTQDELDELENPTVPDEVDSFDDGPDLADDLADALCVPFTLRAVNLAFARLGITDMLTAASDLLTPTSQERSLAAQFFEHTLRFVLRDFPWAHATRYASLVLVDGSISDPTNADWVYGFRAPAGCLFVRRIIRPELGRKHDAKPPAFRMVVDDVGPLVYVTDDGVQFDSNDEPFIEIEYTVRPACGAKAGGDQKFVSAFAFRLAFDLATGLSRDEKTIARMERGYIIEKNTASTTVQNEQQQQPPGDPDWLLGR